LGYAVFDHDVDVIPIGVGLKVPDHRDLPTHAATSAAVATLIDHARPVII
jgi:hypothetical protein